MDDELKEEIQAGTQLKKVDPDELEAYEAEKQKRLAEIQELAAKLEAEGVTEEGDEAPADNPDDSQ
ncbi:MAG TPA: hypothetical protein VKM55_13460 [Candidatus Lokiarchaeia archaeon]|nr:hypothetical protein [Candidatus Lokiarchaeia archaeon]